MRKLVIALIVVLAMAGIADGETLNKKIKVKITTYTANECPNERTKHNTIPKVGRTCALSRDLVRKYKLKFGTPVYVHGHGVFRFEDTTAERIKNTVDIYTVKEPRGLWQCWVSFGEQF